MLYVAGVLLIALGLLHSVRGGRNLINPILELEGLPQILGGSNDTRFTLQVGWHLLTLTWWGNAVAMFSMALHPETLSAAFLLVNSAIAGATACAALILTRGRHPSWMLLIPIALLTGIEGASGLLL